VESYACVGKPETERYGIKIWNKCF
jgi:hypothetical protein